MGGSSVPTIGLGQTHFLSAVCVYYQRAMQLLTPTYFLAEKLSSIIREQLIGGTHRHDHISQLQNRDTYTMHYSKPTISHIDAELSILHSLQDTTASSTPLAHTTLLTHATNSHCRQHHSQGCSNQQTLNQTFAHL